MKIKCASSKKNPKTTSAGTETETTIIFETAIRFEISCSSIIFVKLGFVTYNVSVRL
jgi:hypothetical protein